MELKFAIPRVSVTDYGLTPAQYHGCLDKLWGALQLTGVQDDDVFTIAARKIKAQRLEIEQLKEDIAEHLENTRLRAALKQAHLALHNEKTTGVFQIAALHGLCYTGPAFTEDDYHKAIGKVCEGTGTP